MFIDASAIIAIIAREPESVALAARLGQAGQPYTSPIALYAAVLGLARVGNSSIGDAAVVLNLFLEEIGAQIMPITAEIGRAALSAFERYGRGLHPAALNTGDCFAYACVRELDLPILFKGEDFPQTDIAIA